MLESIAWDARIDQARVVITVRHRGAPGDEREVPGTDVMAFGRGGLVITAQDEPGMDYAAEVTIPLHRILRIMDERDGRVLYEKERKKNN